MKAIHPLSLLFLAAQALSAGGNPPEDLSQLRMLEATKASALGSAPFDREAARARYERVYARAADGRTRSEFAPVEIPTATPQFAEETHRNLTHIAAVYWGLPANRAERMTAAADQPDVNQAGFDHLYNQQWSHAYILASNNTWIWGDADDDFYGNLEGYDGGLEGHEGWQEMSAKEHYDQGNQFMGDWYVGYATHYIEDASLVVHASAPSLTRMDLLTKHFAIEDWLKANANQGHRLLDAVAADPYYYPITNSKTSLHNAAYFACYWSKDVGRRAWDAYRACGYPVAAGSGSPELVAAAKEMLIRAGRYAKGTLKYALDKNGQWVAKY